MPFPPITKDANFDYESALDEHVRFPELIEVARHANYFAQRVLEANIATVKDSTDLLKAEIAREEALLAEEKRTLQEVDKNAKRAEAERKRQTKNVCILLFHPTFDLMTHATFFRSTLSFDSLVNSHQAQN